MEMTPEKAEHWLTYADAQQRGLAGALLQSVARETTRRIDALGLPSAARFAAYEQFDLYVRWVNVVLWSADMN